MRASVASNSHFELGGGDASGHDLWSAVCRDGLTLLRSAPVQGVSRPPHTASRDCRNGSPLARAIPCAPAPECGEMRKKHCDQGKATRISICAPTRSAASRDGMAGWAGEGGGRFGERREYEAPTLPSTPRQHGAARHHKSQPRNASPTSITTPHQPPTRQPQNTCLVAMRIAGLRHHCLTASTCTITRTFLGKPQSMP